MEAMIVHDAAIVQAMRAGTLSHFLAAILHPMNQSGMQQLDETVRQQTERPIPGQVVRTAPIPSPLGGAKSAKPAVHPGGGRVLHPTVCTPVGSDPPSYVCAPVASYAVVSGDTLWGIARRFYGDGNQWRRIYSANRHVVGSNPNLIRPGQKLHVP